MNGQKNINQSLVSSIVDDRMFMNKFIILLSLIIALSVYIILGAANSVDDLSKISYTNLKNDIVTLDDIERKVNGNLVSLEIVEDDFSEISFEDLGVIENQNNSISKVESKVIQHKIVKTKPVLKKKIFITSQVSSKSKGSSNSFSFMKKKFYATNSSDISLKIAKKFYNTKSYKKALKWALITNEIDAKSEQSWIIFANVKDKMGKTKDAIAALSHYLKEHDSNKAKRLLVTLKAKV
jgi:hypothetical protein